MKRKLSLDYIAGFVDGEGSIAIHRTWCEKRNYWNVGVRFFLTSTNRNILELIKVRLGGGIEREIISFGHKRVFKLCFYSQASVERVLLSLRDYLVIKRPQCELMLKYLRLRRAACRAKYTKREMNIVSRIYELNKRGSV